MTEFDADELKFKISRVLGNHLSKAVTIGSEEKEEHSSRQFDIEIEGHKFLGVFRAKSELSQVVRAIEEGRGIKRELKNGQKPIIVIVPFMGEVGREHCAKENISWLDLSGNAHISEKNLTIHIVGKENKYKRPGRPSNLFAPKGSRVARFLLINDEKKVKQKAIVEGTDLGKGYVSKITKGLEEEGFIVRDKGGVQVKAPGLLLDAWREQYDFSNHEIVKGTVPAKSGQDLMKRVEDFCEKQNFRHAATGLVAGWCYTKFADFRINSFYIPFSVIDTVSNELGFQEGAKGSNLWFVKTNDNGVFQGSKKVNGVECVHPVQAYLDLICGHPERSKEAAEELRKELLTWNNDG